MADGPSGAGLTVVTSFNREGYELYGKRFVDSFDRYWPGNVGLAIYVEDTGNYPATYPCTYTVPLKDLTQWRAFESHILNFPVMCGRMPNGQYNIRYDARMARKSFIQADALRVFKGKVFWIDADVITHAEVPEDFLDRMLPDGKLCCYLGRDGWMYTESGFIGFNSEHPAADRFMELYLSWFATGAIFTMSHWHDCMAFDATRHCSEADWFVNLAAGLPHGTMHPFVNSALGAYMDHRKGPRKTGRSTNEDLVIKREEPYWNAA